MDKTVKELAEIYGVSKQAIQYHVKKLPKEVTKFDTKNGTKILLVNEKGQEILENLLSNKVTKEPTKQVTNFADKEIIEIRHQLELAEQENKHLKERLDILEQEKIDNDDRIDNLIKLLDQSQQLQAIAEQKIKVLEQKDIDKQEEVKPEEIKHWWQFWK